MLELPEIFTIAKQMNAELPGKQIIRIVVNQSPLKFGFFKPAAERFESLLVGQTIQNVTHNRGHWLQIELDQGSLDMGDMGGRILLHQSAETLPAKHQLLLELSDHRYLTVSLVLWGFLNVVRPGDKRGPQTIKTPPLGDDFQFERFQELVKDTSIGPKTSLKYFMISVPGLGGVGNGCLQDILFNSRLHPKRAVVSLTSEEQIAMHTAVRSTLQQMVNLGGRDSEHDLYDQPGQYRSILGSHAVGKPCPRCGTPIEKISFLGGASYFCPHCQV